MTEPETPRGKDAAARLEFQVIAGLPATDLATRLSDLSTEHWAVVTFAASAPGEYTALLSRPAPRTRR